MKFYAILPLALLALVHTALANDQLRNAQTELKNLGFYYGDVNGQPGTETTAAIRRYQIRNGLEVTGSLDESTLRALGLGSRKKAVAKTAPAPKPKPTPPPPPVVVEKKSPPVNLRRNETVEESDRAFLRREESRTPAPDAVAPVAPVFPDPEPRSNPSIVEPPAPLDAPSPDYPVLFAGTPYADASLEVQQQTLRRAQSLLASRRFYRDIVDGLPGPATEEALLTFQRAYRLTLTGRLDTDTLAALGMVSGGTKYSASGGFRAPQRVYRGIWIERSF